MNTKLISAKYLTLSVFLSVRAVVIISIVFISGVSTVEDSRAQDDGNVVRVGWVSDLTGPASKYAADQAARIAVDEINAAGGIRGAKFELIMEDGRCDGAAATTAAHKLIDIDRVKFILGGHCSTETMAIAPIAERSKVVLLASISSTPGLSGVGKYVFRTTPISTVQSELIAGYAIKKIGAKRIAVLYEDTSYVGPIAQAMKDEYLANGGKIVYFDSYIPGTMDFRAQLTMAKRAKPDAFYIGSQAQDVTVVLIKQLRELGISVPLFGNETVGNTIQTAPNAKDLLNDLVFAEPAFAQDSTETQKFIQEFERRYHTVGLPYGIWTAESYDGVKILAKVLNECGLDPEKVIGCLEKVKDYPGVSGKITINEKHDGVRTYTLKHVKNGQIVVIGNAE